MPQGRGEMHRSRDDGKSEQDHHRLGHLSATHTLQAQRGMSPAPGVSPGDGQPFFLAPCVSMCTIFTNTHTLHMSMCTPTRTHTGFYTYEHSRIHVHTHARMYM